MASGIMAGRAYLRSAGFALALSLPAMGAAPAANGADVAINAELGASGLNTTLDLPTRGVNLLFQNDTYTLSGNGLPEPLIANTFSIQPLIPLPLGSMGLYLRPFLPIRYRPIFAPNLGDEYRFGPGDSALVAALVPFPEWPILVAAGPVASLAGRHGPGHLRRLERARR